MRGRAQNRPNNEIGRGGGRAKFARYWEPLRTSRLVGFPEHAGSPIAFLRHAGIYRSDRTSPHENLGRGTASRWSGPGQVKERDERIASWGPSSTMSSDRLFLDRGARQHGPSPLHRHAQTNMRFSPAWPKGDISTLP